MENQDVTENESIAYVNSTDDLNVGDYLTIANENHMLNGGVFEVRHVELPFVLLQLHVYPNGEKVRDCIIPFHFHQELKLKKISKKYVEIMNRTDRVIQKPTIVESPMAVDQIIDRDGNVAVLEIPAMTDVTPNYFQTLLAKVRDRRGSAITSLLSPTLPEPTVEPIVANPDSVKPPVVDTSLTPAVEQKKINKNDEKIAKLKKKIERLERDRDI